MEQKYLTILEFPKVLERLASYAAFSASKALALALQPSPYLSEAQGWQAETREAEHLLSVKVNIGVGGARDVRPYVIRASRNLVLIPEELLEVRQTLIAARELQRAIVRMADVYPRLADIAQRIEECPGVVNAIGQAIDDNGQVKDSASPTLARIRRELSVAYGRLMEKLNRIMSSSAQYLQETLITQRGGRYVIPLRAEFKGRVQGIIHDQSGSGATLFIEPLATVELNNKWRQLQLDEENEIQKILVELAELISSHAPLINHTVNALAELDLAFAKAKYGVAIRAVEPILRSFEPPKPKRGEKPEAEGETPYFKLVSARHPLLDPKTVVPIDVTLGEGVRMLVITGPNTGGKTVSLKTIGLLAAMAQAGLRIPAGEGSTLPVFNHILADIGDEQSIEQSLSTFSGHMTNVVHILDQCDEESLVIFDELGAGTDPIEGSALARAILSDLLERRVTTFVATHYPELKAFAYTTPGVTNASMEFNTETLSPTYRLLIGLPGASNAFTIARRLGLPQEVIDQAQTLMSEEDQQVEAMILAMKGQTEAAQRLRQEAEAQRQEAENYTRQIETRLKEIDTERQEILNAARADARREIKQARERIRELEAQAQELIKSREAAAAQPVANEVQKELASLESEIVAREKVKARPAPPPKQTPRGPVRPGDKVLVRSFGTTGEVIAVHDKQAEVQLGRFRTTVALADLERQEQAEKQPEILPQAYVSERVVEASPGLELDLRGQVAGEALENLDQYLDRAFLARLPWVRIIHGKGSGVLRQAVRQELGQHPMVSSYRPGREDEGGDGVTIVTMAVN